MLETLREFAQERLAWREESHALRERYAHYYSKLAEQAELNLHGPEQVSWLERLDQEQENLRAALQWFIDKAHAETLSPGFVSQEHRRAPTVAQEDFCPGNLAGTMEATTLALQMTAALAYYWDTRGYYSEGRHWLAQALELSEGKQGEVRLIQARAKALNKAGDFAFLQGEFAQSRLYLEESLALKRQLEDKPGIAAVLNSFGNLALWQHEYELAVRVVQESLSIRQELNDTAGIAIALRNLGNLYTSTGEYQQAAQVFRESLAIAEKLNNKQGQAVALGSLGKVLLFQGHYEQAARLLKESQLLFEELGDKRRLAITLDLIGCVYMNQAHYEQAFEFSFKSLGLERELGDRWGIAASLTNLGNIKFRQGEYNTARSLYLESLEFMCELGERYIGDGLDNLAGLEIAQQEFEKAAQLCGASDKLHEHTNTPRESFQQTKYNNLLAQLHDQLDDTAFNAAWAQGQALELDQALALARSANYLGSGQK
jgi:tetratricopeptide (TPR) repeat protein